MVKDMYIDKTDDKTIIAVLNIDRGIDIFKDAVPANTTQSDGGKAIEIVINGPVMAIALESGDHLMGGSKPLSKLGLSVILPKLTSTRIASKPVFPSILIRWPR